LVIGEFAHCWFDGSCAGGCGHDRAQVGGRVFVAEPLYGFLPGACEVGGDGGNELAVKFASQMRGFVGHRWPSGTKKPGPLSRSGRISPFRVDWRRLSPKAPDETICQIVALILSQSKNASSG
jgi:hypothetical protein